MRGTFLNRITSADSIDQFRWKDDKAHGEERYIRAGTSRAMVAGSRYGLPDVLKAPAGAVNLWKAFSDAMKAAKAKPAATVAA
jgi:hypothetical protein